MQGTLWLVGTPIGNLKDLTERAREVLEQVDIVACEDTRRTRALLTHIGVRAPRLVSFFEGNERVRILEMLAQLRDGTSVALVTDAGMPALSDPGYRLVAACVAEGLPVDAVPGPTALVQALVLSGLPTDRFAFEGFLPRKKGPRRLRLERVAADPRTLIFYESPRRVMDLVRDALDVLGDRRAAMAREMTKVHQEVRHGLLSELAASEEPRGEVVLVVEGATEAEPDLGVLAGTVAALIEGGMSRKEAAEIVAEGAGGSKKALYDASLRIRREDAP